MALTVIKPSGIDTAGNYTVNDITVSANASIANLTVTTTSNLGSVANVHIYGGAGTITISDSNTFDTLTNNVAPSGFKFTAGTTQTVTNFTANGGGTGVDLFTLTSTTPGTQYSISKSSGTVSVQYLSIRDCDATGGADWYAGALSTDVGNNTGWIFTAPPAPSTSGGKFFLFF